VVRVVCALALCVGLFAACSASALAAAVPSVDGEAPQSVGSETAAVGAKIDPNGVATSYELEYVSEAQFGASGWAAATTQPGGELPAGEEPVAVRAVLAGLTQGTGYRFRFRASNSVDAPGESTPGAGALFTTLALASTGLPDGRIAELVSTSGIYGEPYAHPTPRIDNGPNAVRSIFQAAADGERVEYVGEAPETGGSGAIGEGFLGNDWLATRTPEGWKTGVISPPEASGEEEEFVSPYFQNFSENLTSGFVEYDGIPQLSPAAPEHCEVLYRRDNETNSYSPLLTGTERPGECGSPQFAGEDSHGDVIFQSQAALTPNASPATDAAGGSHAVVGVMGPNAPESCDFGCNLYLLTGGGARLVNVLPGPSEQAVPNATFGGFAGSDPTAHAELPDFSNAISADGSRIFWTDTQEGEDFKHVYVLEDGSNEVQVSASGPAQYWTATPDGRYAYYTEAGDLWRFDTASNTAIRLTVGGTIQGVIGTNQTGEDGAYVYFIGDSVLTGAQQNARHESAQPGQPNLYVQHAATITFIATLSPNDNEISAEQNVSANFGDWAADVGERTAQVTPDGLHVVFESDQPLTGYDNHDAELGNSAVMETFVFDARSAQLSCASCNPTGLPPTVGHTEPSESLLPVSLPSFTTLPKWISASGGRVFFNTPQPLSPQATDNTWNVYEWESVGEGSCTASRASTVTSGCTFLLSGGESEVPSLFVDADVEGNNVFFTHLGSLEQVSAPAAENELYDARIAGGFPINASGCSSAACVSAPVSSPSFVFPSTTFTTGSGNYAPAPAKPRLVLTRAQKLTRALAGCKRDRRAKRRKLCVAKARARYGSKRVTAGRGKRSRG
jgi:hypothetical protein